MISCYKHNLLIYSSHDWKIKSLLSQTIRDMKSLKVYTYRDLMSLIMYINICLIFPILDIDKYLIILNIIPKSATNQTKRNQEQVAGNQENKHVMKLEMRIYCT